MAGNVIFRGPTKDEPETVNLSVAGAYLPGIMVTEDGSTLTMAVASADETIADDTESELLILGNRSLDGQDVDTQYASGDTGIAFRTRPVESYQVRLAAATYNYGDKLKLSTLGYLAKTDKSDRVIAYFADASGEYAAGALADVRIANSFLTAAS